MRHFAMVVTLLAAALLVSSLGGQVMPEYGTILREGAKPGQFNFPNIPGMTSPAQQTARKETIGDIAFIHKGDIYTVTVDGKQFRRLTSDGRNAFPIWSASGRHIAFTKAKPSKPKDPPSSSLWIVTWDGKYSRALTPEKAYTGMYPVAWLPGDKGLLVTVEHLESDVGPELQVVTLDGKPYPPYQKWVAAGTKSGFYKDQADKHLFQFTPGQAGAFSPDGRQMILTAGTEFFIDAPRLDLYRTDTDGTGLRLLEKMPRGWIKCLRWHPRGGRVLSAEDHYPEEGKHYAGIWLRDANGKALKRLADLPTASLCCMDWSPTGDYVIYQKTDKEFGGLDYPGTFAAMSAHSSIWVMKSDGTKPHKLSDNACNPDWR